MAITRLLRPRLALARPTLHLHHQQTRTFLPNPFPAPFNPLSASNGIQSLTAQRTLPYPHLPLYAIIADIAAYRSFVPFCTHSTVERWSDPDATFQQRWPSAGRITVGWRHIAETFTSRVFCVPARVVESVSGATETSLPPADIGHHLRAADGEAARPRSSGGVEDGLLRHLRSKWTVEPVSGRGEAPEQTHVTLALEFAFANPMYTALSAGATPFIADKMIEAFEERIELVMADPQQAEALMQRFKKA